MTTKSFRQMLADKEVKRADALKVRLEDIHEEPGFNLRDLDAVDPDGVSFQDGIDALAEFIAAGGIYPPLEIRPRNDGGVWLVDGHRRRLALNQLDAAGRLPRDPKDGEAWVAIVPFTGNDADRVARVITSQQGRRLNDLEKANGCKRLAAFGWAPDQIGKAIGLTRQRVDQLLYLANAPARVQHGVKNGELSGSVAVELVRKHGDQAGEVLEAELEKAKSDGKGKVTAGTMKGPSVPRGLLDDMHGIATKMHKAFKPDDLLAIERYHRGEITEGTVEISLEAAMQFHLMLEEGARILADKEAKAREKADKAKQMELQEGAQ